MTRRSAGGRLADRLHGRRRLQVGLLLSGPLAWLGVAYLGSLVVLFVAAFWHLDDFSGKVVHEYSLENFQTLWNTPVYRTIVLRTVGIAALVTITDILLALPLAFYMAKIASRRVRGILVVAVLMPLWASYLVKVYAWRTMLAHDGIINWALAPFGLHGPGYGFVATWIVFSYLWLPYMILPVYAGFERISNSLVDASGDLGGAAGHDVPPRRRAARDARGRGRLDLHVLADAGRLHHPAAGVLHAVHRQRRLRERRRREQPAAGRGLRDGARGRDGRLPR